MNWNFMWIYVTGLDVDFWFLVSFFGGSCLIESVLSQVWHHLNQQKAESFAPSFDRAIVTMICGSSNDSLVVTWLMFGAKCGELGMTVWFVGNLKISVWISTFLVESYRWDELWIDLDEEWTSIFWRVQWTSSLIWVNLVFSILAKLFDKFYANISDLTANSPQKVKIHPEKATKVAFTWTISRQLWRILSLHPIPHRLLAHLQQCLFVCLQYWRLQSHGTLIWVYIVGKNDKLRIFSQQNLEDISHLQNSRIDSPQKSLRCFHPCVSCPNMEPYLGKL